MKVRTRQACSWPILAVAVISLMTAPGCSKSTDRSDTLACLTFPASSLPKNVTLAPWTGSDKLPWMTSNPFLSRDKHIISDLEADMPVQRGNVTEVYLAAYWVGKPNQSVVEISVTALRFSQPAVASRAARAMQPQIDEDAKVEPHSAPTLLCRGRVLCIVGHTSAVDNDTWRAMLRLVENALAQVP